MQPCNIGKGLTSWLSCVLCFLVVLSLSHNVLIHTKAKGEVGILKHFKPWRHNSFLHLYSQISSKLSHSRAIFRPPDIPWVQDPMTQLTTPHFGAHSWLGDKSPLEG